MDYSCATMDSMLRLLTDYAYVFVYVLFLLNGDFWIQLLPVVEQPMIALGIRFPPLSLSLRLSYLLSRLLGLCGG